MVSLSGNAFRAAVAAEVGFAAIPDRLWDRCYDPELERRFGRGRTKADRNSAVRETARWLRDEISFARATVAALDAGAGPSQSQVSGPDIRAVSTIPQEMPEPFFVTLSQYEQDRAWAFSQEIATLADAIHGNRIRRFREEKLGGQLIHRDDVEAWLRSPSSSLLVDELSYYAEWIADELPWSTDEASYYILTGETPTIQPLRGTFTRARLARREQRGLITIEVEPWVSEKTVARLYGEIRVRVLPRHDIRPHSMAVWRFVESLHSADRPTLRDVWRELAAGRPANAVGLREVWREWLHAHPDLGSLSVADAFERWKEIHAGESKRQYTHFRRALLSGIEHGDTITWPGYRRLSTAPASQQPSKSAQSHPDPSSAT